MTHPEPLTPVQVLLIPFQQPERELQALVQLCASKGLMPETPAAGAQRTGRFTFHSDDGKSDGQLSMMAELGVLRFVIRGAEADELAQLVASYLPAMSATTVIAQLSGGGNVAELRIYAVLAVLAFEDADVAMANVGQRIVDDGPDALREGIVQGLAFMATPEVGPHLEAIAARFPDDPAGDMAKRAYDQLAAHGLFKKSAARLVEQARECVEAEPEEALKLLEEAAKSGHASQEMGLLAARAHRIAGRAAQALTMLATIDAGPFAVEAYTERALVNERLGKLADGLRDAEAALRLDATAEVAKAAATRLALQLNKGDANPSQRRAKLDEAIAERADDVGLRVQRAELRLSQGDGVGALEDLIEAAKLDPSDGRVVVLRAEAELASRRFAAALRSATLARKAAPEHMMAQASLLRGRAYLALDEPLRALGAFTEAKATLDLDPARLGMGVAYELLGRDDEALEAYRAATERSSAATLGDALRLAPYQPLPLLERAAAIAAAVVERPAQKAGSEPVDPLFKRCLGCGSIALGRRMSCKECGGRDFLR